MRPKIEKPDLQNRRLYPMGLAKPGESCRLPVDWPRLDRHDATGLVFGRFWNWTKLCIQSKPRPLAGYLDPLLTQITDCSIVFRSACMQIVSHQASNSIMRMKNSILNHVCSFKVIPEISLARCLVTRLVSARLRVVASRSASDTQIWNCSRLSAVMFATP